jgi:hypothetical protein
VQSGEVTFEVALAAATRPSDFQLKMQTFRRRSPTGKGADTPSTPGEKPEQGFQTGSGMEFLNG